MGAYFREPHPQGREHQHAYGLPAGRMMRVQRARGWILLCESGELLLTQQDDGRDHVLKAGDRIAIATPGRVLAEAVASARDVRFRLIRPREFFPLSRPVVRLVSLRVSLPAAAAAQARTAFAVPASPQGALPLTYKTVFRDPRLMESLLRNARRQRNAAIAALAVNAAGAVGRRGLSGIIAGRAAAAMAGRWLWRGLQVLRLRLPSLQESFAAAVFLRSRSWH